MRAAVFHGAGKPLSLDTLDDPKPGPTEIVIKVHRCGICGTDLSMTSGHGWDFPVGSVLGHEYAGEIVELGSKVEGLKKGDRVTALPSDGCGHCRACAEGNFPMCDNVHGAMGGFGEYMALPAKVAVKLPSTLSLADGAMVEPLAVALHGIRVSDFKPGDRVLVQGGGSVALMAIYWAKRLGARRVVATSRSQRRAALALEMGADAFVQDGENEVPEVAQALGGAPEIVFECVGASGLLGKAIMHVAKFGQVASLGFCTSPDPMIPALGAMKGARLIFPVGYALRDFYYSAEALNAGGPDPKALITSVVSLDQLPATFEKLRGPNTETKVHVSLTGQ
jgi:(R,R)-butanediol dehydrogenase/meso-butanediol dehydrogenase/diacetyl reductase